METPLTSIEEYNPTKPDHSTNKVELNSSFLLHNGFTSNTASAYIINHNQISDIEMISVKSAVTYTSLKDILPTAASSSPLSMNSQTTHNASWNEIPIKNPLVKQAALAYLQPMSTPPIAGNNGVFRRLGDIICCRECGCLGWFNEMVHKALTDLFLDRRRIPMDDYDDEDYDDEDEYSG